MTDDIDPIEEIHKIRKAMYAEAGGTPAAFVRYLRTLEKKRIRQPAKPRAKAAVRKSEKRQRKVAVSQ